MTAVDRRQMTQHTVEQEIYNLHAAQLRLIHKISNNV